MRALNTAGSGMVSQQMNLDVIANNLANVNTTAFKSQRAEFQDLMYQTLRASGAANNGETSLPQSVQVGLGSRFSASATNFNMGSLLTTGGVTDIAINGEGFYQVQIPGGEVAYTRDGSFKRDANGLIVTSDGNPLIPNMTLPSGARAISISPEGYVSAILPGNNDPTELGQIQLAIFTNPSGLTRIGQNMFQAGGGSGDASLVTPGTEGSGTIQQNFLEGSNVQVVEEMVKMISAQRAYEINSKAIQTSDDMLSVLNSLKR